MKDLIKRILNTDPKQRISIGLLRQHDWYTKVKPTDMDGIVIGKDKIPVIDEFNELLKNHFTGENLEQSVTFVQNNKHN